MTFARRSGSVLAVTLVVGILTTTGAGAGDHTTARGTPRYCGDVSGIAVTAVGARITCRSARAVVRRVHARRVGRTATGGWRCTLYSRTSGSCSGARGQINWEQNEMG